MRRVVTLAAQAAVVALMVALAAEAVHYWRARQIRDALYEAFTPVQITNCELQRFGNARSCRLPPARELI